MATKKFDYNTAIAAIDEAAGAGRDLYFRDPFASFAVMRGKKEDACVASNPPTQLLQTQWIDSNTMEMYPLSGQHASASALWGTLVGKYGSEPEALRFQILMDALITRSLPSAIQALAEYTLIEAVPEDVLTAEIAKRVGKEAAPHVLALLKAGASMLSNVTEETTKTRKVRASKAVNLTTKTVEEPRKRKAAKNAVRATPIPKAPKDIATKASQRAVKDAIVKAQAG